MSLGLKALRRLRPDYGIWRHFDYEYERGKLAFDVINGSPLLREWVDDPKATAGRSRRDLPCPTRKSWADERRGRADLLIDGRKPPAPRGVVRGWTWLCGDPEALHGYDKEWAGCSHCSLS